MRIHTHIHTHIYTHIHSYTHAHTHIYIYTCTHVHMCIHTYIQIHTDIHTHMSIPTHTYPRSWWNSCYNVVTNQDTVNNPIQCSSLLFTVKRRYVVHHRCIKTKRYKLQLFIYVPDWLYLLNIFYSLACAASESHADLQLINKTIANLPYWPLVHNVSHLPLPKLCFF